MGYLPTKVYSDSIASGASTSAGFAIAEGYTNIGVQIATMSTATVVQVQHSADGGTTFYNLYSANVLTSTVQAANMLIPTGVASSGGMIALNVGGLRHVRFVTTAVVSGGVGFKVICSD